MALGSLAAAVIMFGIASDAPTPATLAAAADAGITAESMVVAGATPEAASAALSNIAAATDAVAQLAAARAVVDGACEALAAAEADLLARPGDPSSLAARDAAASALAAARGSLESARAEVRSLALAGAPSGIGAALTTYLAGEGKGVPPEFRAEPRTPEQWSAIEVALRAEARAARIGGETGASEAALLLSVRSSAAVSEARARIDAGLSAMATVFSVEAPPN